MVRRFEGKYKPVPPNGEEEVELEDVTVRQNDYLREGEPLRLETLLPTDKEG